MHDSNERETKERVGTLALALSMFRRNASAHGEVDLLKEIQGSGGQTTVQDPAEEYEIIYSKDTLLRSTTITRGISFLASLQFF